MSDREIPVELQPSIPVYLSEGKVYPREIGGRFQRLRVAAVVWLLGMYYLFPWLSWDGRQAVLFDLPARRFHVFGLTFWPQDFIFLALLLVLAGLALFFFTALAGRLWCGYACPQTVWTEVFLWMERITEGDRRARIKLDTAPWSLAKFRRKFAKHTLWAVFALWTGFTFVGFFTPITELAARLPQLDWSGWETFWVLFYSFATWGNAGFLREQVCKYMCPYARFQSAMFDRNTLIVAYDARRGEPRGARGKSLGSVAQRGRELLSPQAAQQELASAFLRARPAAGAGAVRISTGLFDQQIEQQLGADVHDSPHDREVLGDCIDCTLCVQVCPTGIDIRNGLQYECIACAACVDACDSVMDRIGYPRGLILHSTQNALEGKPSRVVRPRIVVVALLLVALLVGWGVGIGQRAPLILDVLRDRNALYREIAGGEIENAYTLKISNREDAPQRYRIRIEGAPMLALEAPAEVSVAALSTVEQPITLRAPRDAVRGRQQLILVVDKLDGGSGEARQPSAFFAPP